jgi:3-(3-hydroxy-phenyl)propionate hydroxylase
MTGGGNVGNAARRILLPRLHFIPGLRDRVVDSTTPALHRSALVCKSHSWLTGRLCPNPAVQEGKRLDDILGTDFALITTRRPRAADEALLRRHKVVVLTAEPGSALDEWLRRGRATAALVRPDRTVARAGRDLTALCAWAASTLRER